MKQAYISCPLDENIVKVHEVGAKLNVMGYSSWWHERGEQYGTNKLMLSDMFVLISSGNQFDFTKEGMTSGCKKELELAADLHKKLYLAYWKKGYGLHIYSINMTALERGRVMGQSKAYLQPYQTLQIINGYAIY